MRVIILKRMVEYLQDAPLTPALNAITPGGRREILAEDVRCSCDLW